MVANEDDAYWDSDLETKCAAGIHCSRNSIHGYDFKCDVQDHPVQRSAVSDLSTPRGGQERWNIPIVLWLIILHLPICKGLWSLSLVAQGSNGYEEGANNSLKYFTPFANELIHVCQGFDVNRSDLVQPRMDASNEAFNAFQRKMHNELHMKEPVQVVKANVDAMQLVGRILFESETNGTSFFQEVRRPPASDFFQHEQHVLDGFTDKVAQILDGAMQKAWSYAMTVSVKRALQEQQTVVDISAGIDVSDDKSKNVYFKAEPARRDLG